MTEFALSRVVTVAYLFIITIKVFFIFTRTIFFFMDTTQTPEKVSYFKDCLYRFKRQEKKTKPAKIAKKYILTMSILRMCPSGLLLSTI